MAMMWVNAHIAKYIACLLVSSRSSAILPKVWTFSLLALYPIQSNQRYCRVSFVQPIDRICRQAVLLNLLLSYGLRRLA